MELFGVSCLYKHCDRMLELGANNLSAIENGDKKIYWRWWYYCGGFCSLRRPWMGVAEEDEEPDEKVGDEVDQKSVKLVF